MTMWTFDSGWMCPKVDDRADSCNYHSRPCRSHHWLRLLLYRLTVSGHRWSYLTKGSKLIILLPIIGGRGTHGTLSLKMTYLDHSPAVVEAPRNPAGEDMGLHHKLEVGLLGVGPGVVHTFDQP